MNAQDAPLGIVHDMPADEYHAIPALGASGLGKLARSPRHYYAAALDPKRPQDAPTPAMRAGTLAHCAILEPHALQDRYIVRPDGLDGRTNDGKAWLASVPAGAEAITQEQMSAATLQAEAIRGLYEVGPLLAKGRAEVSAFWIDEATGVHCKCRPDWVFPSGDGVILLDLKTSSDASPEAFARSVARYGYHRQAEWYSTGYAKASGRKVYGFVFAVVESDYPHAAASYMLTDESLALARSEIGALLALYADCKRRDYWPGYPSRIQMLALPAWAMTTPQQEIEA